MAQTQEELQRVYNVLHDALVDLYDSARTNELAGPESREDFEDDEAHIAAVETYLAEHFGGFSMNPEPSP